MEADIYIFTERGKKKMAEKTNETAVTEKKETAKKSSSKTTSRSTASKSSAGKSTTGKSGSKSNSRSAASRNSSARSNSGRGGNRNSGGRGRGGNSTANKVYKQSPIVIVCYVLAALMILYACFTAGNTVKQINEYYSAYGMSASAKEYITYIAQALIEPLIHAFTFFMAGYILTAVRKLDSKNYVSEKAAKKSEAKKDDKTVEFNKPAEKAETKAAKAAEDTKKAADKAEAEAKEETKTAKEEFEESLEAELKKVEEKA